MKSNKFEYAVKPTHAVTCIKRSNFLSYNFIWIEPLLRGHLSLKTNLLCPKGVLLIQVWLYSNHPLVKPVKRWSYKRGGLPWKWQFSCILLCQSIWYLAWNERGDLGWEWPYKRGDYCFHLMFWKLILTTSLSRSTRTQLKKTAVCVHLWINCSKSTWI